MKIEIDTNADAYAVAGARSAAQYQESFVKHNTTSSFILQVALNAQALNVVIEQIHFFHYLLLHKRI